MNFLLVFANLIFQLGGFSIFFFFFFFQCVTTEVNLGYFKGQFRETTEKQYLGKRFFFFFFNIYTHKIYFSKRPDQTSNIYHNL